MIQNVNVIYLALLPMDHSALKTKIKNDKNLHQMFIKSVDSDYMTLFYTYLAVYVIYNCALKNMEML